VKSDRRTGRQLGDGVLLLLERRGLSTVVKLTQKEGTSGVHRTKTFSDGAVSEQRKLECQLLDVRGGSICKKRSMY